MTEIERNDYFYVCSLIEYIARETKNHRGYIVECIGQEGIENLLYDAEVNHCLSFEQVCDEVVEEYKIKEGKFDTISECQYDVPSFLDIGKLYSIMIEDCAKEGNEADGTYKDIYFISSVMIVIRYLIPIYIIRIQVISSVHIKKDSCWLKKLKRRNNRCIIT